MIKPTKEKNTIPESEKMLLNEIFDLESKLKDNSSDCPGLDCPAYLDYPVHLDCPKIRQLRLKLSIKNNTNDNTSNNTSDNTNDNTSLYFDDQYASVRSIALKNIRDIKVLEKYVFDRNPDVRLAVLKAMKHCKFDMKMLCCLINDSSVAVRIEFCRLLRKSSYDDELVLQLIKMFDKESEGTFVFGAEDESVEVRKEMIRSLDRLLIGIINYTVDKSKPVKKAIFTDNPTDSPPAVAANISNEYNFSINEPAANNHPANKYSTTAADIKNEFNIGRNELNIGKNEPGTINEENSMMNNLDVLMNSAFTFLCDTLNDDSLTVRILSMKLLYKITKRYPIKKNISEMFGMILCFKEKSSKIRKYLLKTISYLHYNDLSMLEYLFKNEVSGIFGMVDIENVIRKIISRNKSLFYTPTNGISRVNSRRVADSNRAAIIDSNRLTDSNRAAIIDSNRTGISREAILNRATIDKIVMADNEIFQKNKQKKTGRKNNDDLFLFSTAEDRKEYKIRYMADLMVFSTLNIDNLSDQIQSDMKRLEKIRIKQKSYDVSELQNILSLISGYKVMIDSKNRLTEDYSKNRLTGDNTNNRLTGGNDEPIIGINSKLTEENDKSIIGINNKLIYDNMNNKGEIVNLKCITSIAKFIKETLISNPSLIYLTPYKFRFPVKLFNSLAKKYKSVALVKKILKKLIKNRKYMKIKDYSFKVIERDVPEYLPSEFDVITECKYLTKHDIKTVKFIAESDGRRIFYDLNKNMKIQIDCDNCSDRGRIDFYIGVIDSNGDILKLA